MSMDWALCQARSFYLSQPSLGDKGRLGTKGWGRHQQVERMRREQERPEQEKVGQKARK